VNRDSLMLSMPEIVGVLASIIGKKLTAVIAGVKDTGAIVGSKARSPTMRQNSVCVLPITSS
jgi:hypothetical protein